MIEEICPFHPRQVETVGSAQSGPLLAALTRDSTNRDSANVVSPLTFQAGLPPSRTIEFLGLAADRGVSVQVHAGNGIVIGQLPAEAATCAAALSLLNPLRQFAAQVKGSLVIQRCDPDWKQTLPVFGPPNAAWTLMRQLKSQLDPRDLLNRGRVFA